MERTSRTLNVRVGFDTLRPVGSFVEVVRDVLVRPADFFGRLRASEEGSDFVSSGPTWRQLFFAVICAYISIPLLFFVAPFDPILGESAAIFPTEVLFSGIGLITLGFLMILLPLFIALGLYIGTFFQQILVRVFIGRENRGYWATFPVFAYSGAVSLINWIPIVGVLIGLYLIYITACGLRAMHDTTFRRALLAALPIPLVSFVFALIPYFQAL